MPSYWFGDVDGKECTPAGSHDPEYLSLRLDGIRTEMESFSPLAWEAARDCGFVCSREEYIRVLRELCIFRAEKALGIVAGRPEQELVQMVRMRDQLDEAMNLVTERALEWHAARFPEFSRKFRSLGGKKALEVLLAEGSPRVRRVATGMMHLSEVRADLTREIEQMAGEIIPNCTGLVGGIVAARLLAAAGGLEALSRLPAGTIQVLGARTALFAHIRAGSSPPKHGIIYQCRKVHGARRGRRGKVSRTLAAKLALAARIDYFRGERDEEFLDGARAAVERAAGGPGA
jgi:nucleolar protein 56